MAPVTDSIMGALPPAKADAGSAMNDTVRAVGGALGVAVLDTVLSSAYAATLAPATTGLPASLVAAARHSVGAATRAAAALGTSGQPLAAARAAYGSGMHTAPMDHGRHPRRRSP